MTTPYRELFVEGEAVETAFGHCPWCRAAVQFVASDRMAVCRACDATFATSIARVTEGVEPPLPPPVPSTVVRDVTRGAAVMVLFLAFELGLIAMFLFAIGRA